MTPTELRKQRETRQWLWRIHDDWSINVALTVKVVHSRNKALLRKAIAPDSRAHDGHRSEGDVWFFHIQHRDNPGKERVARAHLATIFPLRTASNLAAAVALIRDGNLLEIKEGEYIADIAFLRRRTPEYMDVAVYSAGIRGGFDTLLGF